MARPIGGAQRRGFGIASAREVVLAAARPVDPRERAAALGRSEVRERGPGHAVDAGRRSPRHRAAGVGEALERIDRRTRREAVRGPVGIASEIRGTPASPHVPGCRLPGAMSEIRGFCESAAPSSNATKPGPGTPHAAVRHGSVPPSLARRSQSLLAGGTQCTLATSPSGLRFSVCSLFSHPLARPQWTARRWRKESGPRRRTRAPTKRRSTSRSGSCARGSTWLIA